MAINEKFEPIRRGLLEFLVLKIISTRSVYAADILNELSPTEFASQEGTLYPLLGKLRREGMVEYEWVESEFGPPRKYYRLTEKGGDQLKELNNYWKKLNQTINNIKKSQ